MDNFTVFIIAAVIQTLSFVGLVWAIHTRFTALERDLEALEDTVYQFDTLPPSLKIEDYDK